MRSFVYLCADPGIPVPGTKGASVHVASVLKEFARRKFAGRVSVARGRAETLHGFPIDRLVSAPKTDDPRVRESALFLNNRAPVPSLVDASVDDLPDFVYERYSLWHYAGLARARELGVPFVLEVNSPLPLEAERYRALAQPELAQGVARLLMHDADGVVCVSDEVGAWVSELRGRDEGVWVIPNGFDGELFQPDGPRAADGGEFDRPASPSRREGEPARILFCGSFRPWHGLDDLLEAFRILVGGYGRDAELLMIGDGPGREAFEQRAREWGLRDRIHLTGQLAHDEVPAWARTATIAVAPYPQIESFYFSPLKIFEFMALGLPVVATRIGQVPSIVPHEERGVLCEPGDRPGLARAFAELIDDPHRARTLGQAGYTWAHREASWTARVDEILERIRALP